ncbi:cytochrome P450 [Colletotrichum lupini]|uniref:Cytochrome P450 n=1 Tax=Colletotrichum lupini TaxID=145971 RepID=A0A9Q8T9I4_9PEZI|nr:cytochrome P450 [Colletotrichum lupini]UQC91443.1 cytochrome P450 [Colletotrichum lupini]
MLNVILDLVFSKPFGDLASNLDIYNYIYLTEYNILNIVVAAVLPSLLYILL